MHVGNLTPHAVQLDGLKLMLLPAWLFHNKALLSADKSLLMGAAVGGLVGWSLPSQEFLGPQGPGMGAGALLP